MCFKQNHRDYLTPALFNGEKFETDINETQIIDLLLTATVS